MVLNSGHTLGLAMELLKIQMPRSHFQNAGLNWPMAGLR